MINVVTFHFVFGKKKFMNDDKYWGRLHPFVEVSNLKGIVYYFLMPARLTFINT